MPKSLALLRCALSVVLLSACSQMGASPSLPTQARPARAHAQSATSRRLETIYVDDGNGVSVFDTVGTLLRTIPAAGVLNFLQADSSGHLFVSSLSNFSHQSVLSAYSDRGSRLGNTATGLNGAGIPVETAAHDVWAACGLQKVCEFGAEKQGIISPHFVAYIGTKKYLLYVENIAIDRSGDLAVSSGSQPVVIFAPGSKPPYWKLPNGDLYVGGIAFDKSGDFYMATGDNSGNVDGSIAVYAPKKKSPKLTLSVPAQAFATSLRFDEAGHLYALIPRACANCAAPTIAIYRPNQSQPIRTITSGLESFTLGISMAVDSSGGMYVAGCSSQTACSLQMYAPGASTPYQTVTQGVGSAPYPNVAVGS